ncbi:MAG TPA: tetratricopeptide repeat protein [Methanomassiliicoccales archaeon]|nr:tetratricopeptide repeat protein [Methanomassiliicoccales archaeon]
MTDLAEKLDQNKRERVVQAIRSLSSSDYRELILSLISGIGVRVQKVREEQNSIIIHGQGEESYLILTSRGEYADPELIVRSLVEEAKTSGRVAVFMTLQGLDPGTLNYLEMEKVSYADMDKFLALLEKYGLDEPLLLKEDRKILEDRGEPCLPSVCKLEALLEEAEERHEKGEMARAIQVLDMALEIKPMNDSLWLKKAEYLLETGHPTEALSSANRASELRPGDATTWFLIALIQNQIGDREKELTAYDNVLRINPTHTPALLNKGATLFEMGRLEWALKVFNDLVKHHPQEPQGWNNRGLVLKGLGRLKEAHASFEKSSVLDREFADPLINLARMQEERGERSAAVESWKDVLRLVDSRADIWAHLGRCLMELEQNEDALTAMDRALYLEPSLEQVRNERDSLAKLMGLEEPPAEESAPEQTFVDEVILVEEPEVAIPPAPDEIIEECVPEETPETVEEAPVVHEVLQPTEVLEDVDAPDEIIEEPTIEECAPEEETEMIPFPGHPLPVEVSKERSLQELEPPGQLESLPELLKPVTVNKESLAIETFPEPGALQLVEPPMEAPEREPAPIEAVQPTESEKEVEVPHPKPTWAFDISLPPIGTERQEKAWQEASILLIGGQREKVLKVIDLSLKESSDVELLRLKSRTLLSMGRGEEAAEALKEALRHSPNDPRTILDLEALFHRFGGEGGRLLKGAEGCHEARCRSALDLLERGEYAELVRMEMRNEALPMKHAKILALIRLGRYREASKLLKVILSEFPAFPEGLNNMGVCMRFMGEFDYDQAIHMMKLALEVDPHYSDAMNNIGCTLFASGRYDQSIECLKAAADEDRRPEYLLNLSNAQMALGNTKGAKESLTSALKMDEGADVLFMLGVIAESEKDYRWALTLFQDALDLSPGFREAQAGRDRARLLSKK